MLRIHSPQCQREASLIHAPLADATCWHRRRCGNIFFVLALFVHLARTSIVTLTSSWSRTSLKFGRRLLSRGGRCLAGRFTTDLNCHHRALQRAARLRLMSPWSTCAAAWEMPPVMAVWSAVAKLTLPPLPWRSVWAKRLPGRWRVCRCWLVGCCNWYPLGRSPWSAECNVGSWPVRRSRHSRCYRWRWPLGRRT